MGVDYHQLLMFVGYGYICSDYNKIPNHIYELFHCKNDERRMLRKLDRVYTLLTVIRAFLNDDIVHNIIERYNLQNTKYSIPSLLKIIIKNHKMYNQFYKSKNYYVGYDFDIDDEFDEQMEQYFLYIESEMISYNKERYRDNPSKSIPLPEADLNRKNEV